MKKFAVSIFLIGIVVAAAAIGIGIYVRDNPEVQAISAVTGIPITPDNGIALRQAALAGNLRMSGLVAFLLEVYPYISQATTIVAAVAAFGLLLLLLIMIIKPVLSILLLAAVAAVIYFGYQGYLGAEVGDFVNMVLEQLKVYFDKIVSFVNEAKIVDTFNDLISR